MKAIFLDIDGVLNCDATPNNRKFPYIVDDRLLARFSELVKATEATGRIRRAACELVHNLQKRKCRQRPARSLPLVPLAWLA
jgi:hypothetical protein